MVASPVSHRTEHVESAQPTPSEHPAGPDSTDDGDGVDDDPDAARRDGDDDGGDSPFQEGNSLADFSELFFSLSGFRLVEAVEKFLFDTPDVFRSNGSSTPKGSRRGATGTRGGPHPQP